MAYTDVIPLSDAKHYLRIDDGLSDDDVQITRMINSSLSYIERQTNTLVYARDKTYFLDDDNFVRVYDYPINSVVTTEIERQNKAGYSNFTVLDGTELVLNVGFENPLDVPSELIDIALQYIKYLYYEAETNENNKGMMPIWLDQMLYSHKRFIL